MSYMETHATLDAAIAHVLSDVYGHNHIERDEDTGGYVTSVDTVSGDVVMWTYENGLESVGADDWTRLMEPYEVICEPVHVRWHFPQLEEFESGKYDALTLEFVMVDRYPDESEGESYDDEMFDPTVGYIYALHVY